jgi:hypothetical protein
MMREFAATKRQRHSFFESLYTLNTMTQSPFDIVVAATAIGSGRTATQNRDGEKSHTSSFATWPNSAAQRPNEEQSPQVLPAGSFMFSST